MMINDSFTYSLKLDPLSRGIIENSINAIFASYLYCFRISPRPVTTGTRGMVKRALCPMLDCLLDLAFLRTAASRERDSSPSQTDCQRKNHPFQAAMSPINDSHPNSGGRPGVWI
jgi:hypothetical protein